MKAYAERRFLGAQALGPDETLVVLTHHELELLELIQKIDYGRIERLMIQGGQPILAECSATSQVRLGGTK